MSAIPEKFLSKTARVNEASIQPLPNSRKIYVQGSRPNIRVPMREITLTDTITAAGREPNAPLTVYDTSGPYTDPDVTIDIREGLPDVRTAWIDERGDTEILPQQSSAYGRARAADPSLDQLRFEGHHRQPRQARGGIGAGTNVTQMHYAKKGIITPEMEFVAIRENLRLEQYRDAIAGQHPGQSFGAAIPQVITPGYRITLLIGDGRSSRPISIIPNWNRSSSAATSWSRSTATSATRR